MQISVIKLNDQLYKYSHKKCYQIKLIKHIESMMQVEISECLV